MLFSPKKFFIFLTIVFLAIGFLIFKNNFYFFSPKPVEAVSLNSVSSVCLDSVSPGGPAIDLAWTKADGASEYQIQRKAPGEADFSFLASITDINTISYRDNLVDSLGEYGIDGTVYYKIVTTWPDGSQDFSAQNSTSIPRCRPFLDAFPNCSDFEVNMNWTKTKGASHYNVYRDGIYLAQTSSLSYADGSLSSLTECSDDVCNFEYMITAFYLDESNVSQQSDSLEEGTVNIDCTPRPPSPAPIIGTPEYRCVSGDSRIYFDWSESTSNLSYYEVYRDDGANLLSATRIDAEFEDSGVSPGSSYTYSLTAFGPEGTYTNAPETTELLTAVNCEPLIKPSVNASSACLSGEAAVDFVLSSGSNTAGYDVYRGTTSGNLSYLTYIDQGGEIVSWTDSGSLTKGQTYYYKFRAKGENGVDPVESDEVSAGTSACLPEDPVLTLNSSCSADNSYVDLNWTGGGNTDHFEISRVGYGSNPIYTTTDNTTKSWTDTNGISNSTSYTYTIEAVGPGGDIASDTKSITTGSCESLSAFNITSVSDPVCSDSANNSSHLKTTISWEPSDGASYYDLYRIDSLGNEEIIGDVADTSFVDFGTGRDLTFDGANDLIYYGNGMIDPDYILGENQTISYWAKGEVSVCDLDGDENFETFTTGTEAGYNTEESNGLDHHFSTGDNSIDCVNKFCHYTFTYDGTTARIYVNGEEKASNSYSVSSMDRASIYIGYMPGVEIDSFMGHSKDYAGPGTLDELRVYNRALSAGEVSLLYQGNYSEDDYSANDLVGIWHFDEPSLQAVYDSSNNNNHHYLGSASEGDSREAIRQTNYPQEDQTYTYKVVAYNDFGESLESSNQIQKTFPNCLPVKVGSPELVPYCSGLNNSAMEINWGYSYRADSYKVYRDSVEIYSGNDLEALDNDGALLDETLYSYSVEAINELGSTVSDIAQITTLDCSVPDPVTNLNFVNDCYNIHYPRVDLTWDFSTDAIGYEVYRWEKGSTPATSPIAELDESTNYFQERADNSIILPGKTYVYEVVALGNGGSSEGVQVEVYVDYCQPFLSFDGLITTCQDNSANNQINWTDLTSYNSESYEIYRNGGLITTINNTESLSDESDWEHIDSTLASNSVFNYQIKAVSFKDSSLDYLSPVYSIETKNCSFIPDAPILSVSQSCKDNLPELNLNWNSIPGAYSYNIYKEDGLGVKTMYPNTSIPNQSYIDYGDHAIEFDGDQDYVDLGSPAELDNMDSLTICAWVNSFSNRESKIYKKENIYFGISGDWGSSAGGLRFYLGREGDGPWNADMWKTNSAIKYDGNWQYACVSYSGLNNGNEALFYLNGEKIEAFHSIGGSNLGEKLSDAPYSASTGNNFEGYMDELDIYDIVLSEVEIKNKYNGVYNNSFGLVKSLHFNEGFGYSTKDDSEFSNGATFPEDEDKTPAWFDVGGEVFPGQNQEDGYSLYSSLRPSRGDSYVYKIKSASDNNNFSSYSNSVPVTVNFCLTAPEPEVYGYCDEYFEQINLFAWENEANISEYELYRNDLSYNSPINGGAEGSGVTPESLVSEDGFLKHWLVLGPFDSDGSESNFDSEQINESGVRPREGKTDGGLTWQEHFASSDYIDFDNIFGGDYKIGYAFAYIYSPVAKTVDMKIGKDNAGKIYLNGAKVFDNYSTTESATKDNHTQSVDLVAGYNKVLVKVLDITGDWGFYLRFTETGTDTNAISHFTAWDSDLVDGTSYNYKILAKNLEGEDYSANVLASLDTDLCDPTFTLYDLDPGDIYCEDGASKIRLDWSSNYNGVAETYGVYRQVDAGSLKRADIHGSISGDTNYYIDNGAQSGVENYYYITVFDIDDTPIENSNVISAVPSDCVGVADTPNPELVESTCGGALPKVKLKWPTTSNTVKYNIYGKKSSDVDYNYKGDVSFNSSATEFYYTDYDFNGDDLGIDYDYRVCSVNVGAGDEFCPVNPISITTLTCDQIEPEPTTIEESGTGAKGRTSWIEFSWEHTNATAYEIYITDSSGNPITTDSFVDPLISVDSTSYSPGDIISYRLEDGSGTFDGSNKYYKLKSTNPYGTSDSNILVSGPPIAVPGDFVLTITPNGNDLDLSWNGAETSEKGGVLTYFVEKSSVPDFSSGVEALTTVIGADFPDELSVSPYSFTDTNALTSKVYYRVVAENSGGQTIAGCDDGAGGQTGESWCQSDLLGYPIWREVSPE